MIRYMCNKCGYEFRTYENPDKRKCPSCTAKAEDHIMLSLSEPDDQKTIRGELQVWDA